jgi:hypothetical protein
MVAVPTGSRSKEHQRAGEINIMDQLNGHLGNNAQGSLPRYNVYNGEYLECLRAIHFAKFRMEITLRFLLHRTLLRNLTFIIFNLRCNFSVVDRRISFVILKS